jgi:hypothetical protein
MVGNCSCGACHFNWRLLKVTETARRGKNLFLRGLGPFSSLLPSDGGCSCRAVGGSRRLKAISTRCGGRRSLSPTSRAS